MKKLFIILTLLMALVLFPSFSGRAEEGLPDDGSQMKAITCNYVVVYPYFASGGDWWTGLAVYNDYSGTNNFVVYVYDSAGIGGPVGIFSLTGFPALKVDLLSNFTESGSVPSVGSLRICAEHQFIADKFTGNSATGGFSELVVNCESSL